MTFVTASISGSFTPAKDFMVAAQPVLQAGGLTLVESYSPVPSANWTAVAFGNGVFVGLVSSTFTAATSPDGVTWTQRTLPQNVQWSSVTFGGGLFVAVASGSSVAATSPDGITWSQRVLPTSSNWSSVTYGGGLYVAVATGSTIAASSTDGISWTQRTLPSSSSWSAVTYGNSTFVAIANLSVAATSTNGVNWTARTLPLSATWTGLAYGAGLFVAVATGQASALSSPDGITWTTRTLPSSSSWKAVVYGASFFVAVASAANVAATSADGITWVAQTDSLASGASSVAFGASVFVAMPSSGANATRTSDGVTWTQPLLTATSNSATADVYKSPAASNQVGVDWYLFLRRLSDTTATVNYQVAESYSSSTHLLSNYGGIGASTTPVASTYQNPGAAVAADQTSTYAASATIVVSGAPTISTYMISATANRVVIGLRAVTTNESACYLGLYDDLLPAGVTQMPLVAAKFPASAAVSNAIGGNSAPATGGFTREPLQTSAATTNFEAAIHNGYNREAASASVSIGWSPLTTNAPLYGNANSPSRVMIGTTRSANPTADAVRGLLIGCVVSTALSAAGDTITSGGKTYARLSGVSTTYGYFVDTAL